jgi:hypothetical protein
LTPLFVRDGGHLDVAAGTALLNRAATFPNDRALTLADFGLDDLDTTIAAAEARCYEHLGAIEIRVREESQRVLERERAKMAKYFDYRDVAAQDRLATSQQTLRQTEAADNSETRRIIPVWKANVGRDERLIEQLVAERAEQLAVLQRRATGSGDLRLVALARVHVMPDEEVE